MRRTHLGALYVVVQVVPEGVDEVDGVVSGIGIGVTREQDWRGRGGHRREGVVVVTRCTVGRRGGGRGGGCALPPTEGDVSDVVAHGGVRVLELQRWLPVAEQHLGGRVAGSPALLELLQRRSGERARLKHFFFFLRDLFGFFSPDRDPHPPRRTCMKTLPMMTSSSSLKTVLKTTVTLSFLASTYLKASAGGGGGGLLPKSGTVPDGEKAGCFCTQAHMDSSSR